MNTAVGFNQEYTKYRLQYSYLKEDAANQIEMYNHLVTVVGPNIETDYKVKVGLRECRVVSKTVDELGLRSPGFADRCAKGLFGRE